MKKYQNIYVAASSQHVGKTTSTLGLVSAYMQQGLKVGYCKPVGQKFLDIKNLRVDKDTILFADLIHFDIDPEVHSPVIIGRGATKTILENPGKYNLENRIIKAKNHLAEHNELTIFEGTGHPGVGSIAQLSNARVAKLTDSGVIMIVEGGIGSTIDMLNLCFSIFEKEGVPIIGVIVNKVIPEKLEMVKKYVGIWLEQKNIPLLGAMPYDETLAYPLVSTILKAVQGDIVFNEECVNNRVEDIMAGSMVELEALKSSQNILLITGHRTLDDAIQTIIRFSKEREIQHSPLAGVVLTGIGEVSSFVKDYCLENKIPVIRTEFDTLGATMKISKIEVKINRRTPWKIEKAIELIKTYVNLDQLLLPA